MSICTHIANTYVYNTQKASKKLYTSTVMTYIIECISIPSFTKSSWSDGSRLAFSESRPNVEPPSLKSYISFKEQKEATKKKNECARNCTVGIL